MKSIRIEICESTFWLLIFALIAALIVSTVGISSHYYTARVTAAFSAGYEEANLPSNHTSSWVKSQKK